MAELPNQTHDNYAWTVYTTWKISFTRLSPVAARLLQVSSFFHHGGITKKIFSDAVLHDSVILGELGPVTEDLEDARKFLAEFLTSSGTWNQLVFMEVAADLQSYSLIEMDPLGDIYSVHPLVHDWTRNTITDARIRECALAILWMCIPHADDHQFITRLLPHLDSLLAQTKELKPYLLSRYGRIFFMRGRAMTAAELFERHTENVKQLRGEDHPDTLQAMANLASSYSDLGQFKEAAELQTIVLAKRKQLLGDDHTDTLQAMANLAPSYSDLGQFKEAAELQTIVLAKSKQLLGEDHPDTLQAMENLASSYSDLGQFKEAAELQTIILAKSKQLLGENHPDTLQAMENLASSYSDLGQSKEAAELEKIVLAAMKQLHGVDHPDTLRAMENLAISYRDLGQFKEAAELETVILATTKQLVGEDRQQA
ncbi:hypothetical protein B0H14DRAFT_2591442 [Mycena olivaceomarginata]|nr:hypothetical protein B0H14DRAFT_2591442 [Mycena olivaceomarginata]